MVSITCLYVQGFRFYSALNVIPQIKIYISELKYKPIATKITLKES